MERTQIRVGSTAARAGERVASGTGVRKATASGRRLSPGLSAHRVWAIQDLNLCPLPCQSSPGPFRAASLQVQCGLYMPLTWAFVAQDRARVHSAARHRMSVRAHLARKDWLSGSPRLGVRRGRPGSQVDRRRPRRGSGSPRRGRGRHEVRPSRPRTLVAVGCRRAARWQPGPVAVPSGEGGDGLDRRPGDLDAVPGHARPS